VLLAELEADVNILSTGVGNGNPTRQNSALHFAAANGHSQTVKTLLEYGADSKQANSDGDTAVMMATSPAVQEELLLPSNRVAKIDVKPEKCVVSLP